MATPPPGRSVELGPRAGDDGGVFVADKTAIGRRIAQAREDVGITNASEFARQIGVAPNTVYRYERGDQLPGAEALVRISEVTGRSIGWLMRGETDSASEAITEWQTTHTGQTASPDELAWIGRIDLEGHEPTNVFFDLLLSARRNGLATADAVRAAAAGRKASED